MHKLPQLHFASTRVRAEIDAVPARSRRGRHHVGSLPMQNMQIQLLSYPVCSLKTLQSDKPA